MPPVHLFAALSAEALMKPPRARGGDRALARAAGARGIPRRHRRIGVATRRPETLDATRRPLYAPTAAAARTPGKGAR